MTSLGTYPSWIWLVHILRRRRRIKAWLRRITRLARVSSGLVGIRSWLTRRIIRLLAGILRLSGIRLLLRVGCLEAPGIGRWLLVVHSSIGLEFKTANY